MNTSFSSLVAYLDAHAARHPEPSTEERPILTISRERGAEGTIIARRAAEFLTESTQGRIPWLVMDDALAEKVVEHHHLPKRISSYLTEEHVSEITDIIEEILGLHPSRWTLVEKMAQTILHMARIGNVIFVGRAAHLVTARFPQARHIRVIGSLESRIAHLIAEGRSPEEAEEEIVQTDRDRSRFVSKFFHTDVKEPTHYDLTINTDRVSIDLAARLAADLVLDAPLPHAPQKTS